MDFCSKMAGLLLLDKIEDDSDKNIVVSPLSFNAIMSMIAAGSTGPTLEQMLVFLGSKNINDLNSEFSEFMAIATSDNDDQNTKDGPTICFLNGAWVNDLYTLRESYQKLVKTVYKAEARNMDFNKVKEVVEELDAWAKTASKGLVTDVLKEENVQRTTRLILGNALYFKGSWVEPFDKEETKDMYFYLLNGDKVKASFMTGCNEYSYRKFDGFKVAKIPYRVGKDKKKKFSMYFFLPNENNGLKDLLKQVNSDSEFLHKYSQLSNYGVDYFWIPKFKFTFLTEDAPRIMDKMGLTLPFDEDCQDLTEMVRLPKGENLYVSGIIQKAFIEIDEQGTEAAAVTFEDDICGYSLDYEPSHFVADHPFMFMIREENSGLVLFTGAVLNPLLEE